MPSDNLQGLLEKFLKREATFINLRNALALYLEKTGQDFDAKHQEYVTLLLRFCAYLHGKNISLPLLEIWEKQTYALDQECLSTVLDDLCAVGLLERTGETFSMHTVWQTVIHRTLTAEEKTPIFHKLYEVLYYAFRRERDFSRNPALLKHAEVFRIYGFPDWKKRLETIQTRAKGHLPPNQPLFLLFLKVEGVLIPNIKNFQQKSRRCLKSFYQFHPSCADYSKEKVLETKIAQLHKSAILSLNALIDSIEDLDWQVGIVLLVNSRQHTLGQLQILFDRHAFGSKIMGLTSENDIKFFLRQYKASCPQLKSFLILHNQLKLVVDYPKHCVVCESLFREDALHLAKEMALKNIWDQMTKPHRSPVFTVFKGPKSEKKTQQTSPLPFFKEQKEEEEKSVFSEASPLKREASL